MTLDSLTKSMEQQLTEDKTQDHLKLRLIFIDHISDQR